MTDDEVKEDVANLFELMAENEVAVGKAEGLDNDKWEEILFTYCENLKAQGRTDKEIWRVAYLAGEWISFFMDDEEDPFSAAMDEIIEDWEGKPERDIHE